MRNALPLVGLLAICLLGLGPFGEGAPDTRVPEPAIDYRARVRDIDLTTFEVTRASFDGFVYLTGSLGRAKVSVPFDKIDRVFFEPGEGLDVIAVVTLKDGQQQSLVVKGTTPCYGVSDFGNVSIELRHLRDVVFLGRAD